MRYRKQILPQEGGEALARAAASSPGAPSRRGGLAGALGALGWWKVALPCPGLHCTSFEAPSNPNPSRMP